MLGDNTDGIGLLSDLERLNFIRPGLRILLIGAGGASRGVLLPLLSLDCAVTITNRTASRAEALAQIFAHTGSVHATDMDKLDGCEFDLIINATSSGIQGEIPAIPASLIHPSLCCYDMFYQKGIRHFFPGVYNREQNNMQMGWECWWGRQHMLFYFGTVYYRRSSQ